jgi:hypothetical protein
VIRFGIVYLLMLAMSYHGEWIGPVGLALGVAASLGVGAWLHRDDRHAFWCLCWAGVGVDLIIAAWLSGAGVAFLPLMGVGGAVLLGSIAALGRRS